MEEIEDPEREGPWDRRGLVVGHVQFGKTAKHRPVLLVVKKNASILRNLNTWVREILAARGDSKAGLCS
jgi:hypothetical protein